MTVNDIKARRGLHQQRIVIDGQDYQTMWPSEGARDRFLLAVASTDQFRPRPSRVTPQNRGIHVTTRHHWS